MTEIWKDIPGYEGLYQVSNLGRVKSLERYRDNNGVQTKVTEKILKVNAVGRGYASVGLFKDGNRKPCFVHRLVADAFLYNPEGKQEVNHIDGNKMNNCADNLEFCTRSENLLHAYNTGLKATKPVAQYDKEMNLIKIYCSVSEAAKNGFKNSDISRCCKGKLKTVGGYIWKYI